MVQRVLRRDRDVAEQAEPHRGLASRHGGPAGGMATKALATSPASTASTAAHAAAHRAQRGAPASPATCRCRRRARPSPPPGAPRLTIGPDSRPDGSAGHRPPRASGRRPAGRARRTRRCQRTQHDRLEPRDPLGVAVRRHMAQAIGMRDRAVVMGASVHLAPNTHRAPRGARPAGRVSPAPACSPRRAPSADSAAAGGRLRSCGAAG